MKELNEVKLLKYSKIPMESPGVETRSAQQRVTMTHSHTMQWSTQRHAGTLPQETGTATLKMEWHKEVKRTKSQAKYQYQITGQNFCVMIINTCTLCSTADGAIVDITHWSGHWRTNILPIIRPIEIQFASFVTPRLVFHENSTILGHLYTWNK